MNGSNWQSCVYRVSSFVKACPFRDSHNPVTVDLPQWTGQAGGFPGQQEKQRCA